MSTFSPSYLHKNRFGKYHFRCRIPVNIRRKYNLKKVEIRKSLGTGNRTEALRLSRILWVKLQRNDFIMNDFEADIERQDRLLREGRPLYQELQTLRAKPDFIPSDEEEFFDWLAPFQKEAIIVYEQYLKAREKEKQVKESKAVSEAIQPVTDTGNNGNSVSKGEIETIVKEAVQQAGKKKLTIMGLQEAFDTYIPLEFPDRDPKKDGYVRKIRSDIQLFIDIVEVENCCDLTNELIVHYTDVFRQLPLKYDDKKSCKGLTYLEMSKLPNEERPKKTTIKNKVNNVRAFLGWCEGRNYIDVEYEATFKRLRQVRGGKGKGGGNKRVPYTPDELKLLFNSKVYIQGTHITANHHWIPLIGIFTGARLNEICQLRKDNIVKDSLSNIWYFDFNDYSDGSSIKTDAGIRFVPVHPELRRLGFFNYYKTRDEGELLFPKWRNNDAVCVDQMRWFSRTYTKNCGVEKPNGIMKDFHSLRNTIINAMKQGNVPVASAREIVGHEDDDMSYGNYANSLDLPSRKKIIDKIKYPSIDWNLVKERGWNKN